MINRIALLSAMMGCVISCSKVAEPQSALFGVSGVFTVEDMLKELTSHSPAAVAAREASKAITEKLGALTPSAYHAYLSNHADNSVYIVNGLRFSGLKDKLNEQKPKFEQLSSKYSSVKEMWSSKESLASNSLSLAEIKSSIKAVHDQLYRGSSSLGLADTRINYDNGYQECKDCGTFWNFWTWGRPACGGATTECHWHNNNPSSASNGGDKSSSGKGSSTSSSASGKGKGSGSGSGNGNSASTASPRSKCTSNGGKGYGTTWKDSNGDTLSKNDADYSDSSICSQK